MIARLTRRASSSIALSRDKEISGKIDVPMGSVRGQFLGTGVAQSCQEILRSGSGR